MSGVRVLVVEDDPSARAPLQTLLAADGHEVSTASDGLAGLGQVAAASPALVLLDLVMPELGGVRVRHELRGDPALAQTPVIVVTGQEDALPGVRALLGDDDVFLEPFAGDAPLARASAVTGGPSS